MNLESQRPKVEHCEKEQDLCTVLPRGQVQCGHHGVHWTWQGEGPVKSSWAGARGGSPVVFIQFMTGVAQCSTYLHFGLVVLGGG